MTIEADIKTTLDSGVALVSSRNYGGNLPQQPVYPNIVYTRIDKDDLVSLDGGAGGGKKRGVFTIDCRAETYAEAHAVADQAIDAMESATLFKAINLTESDIPFEDVIRVYRVTLDFSVWYKRV